MKKFVALSLMALMLVGTKAFSQYPAMGVHLSGGISPYRTSQSSNVTIGGGATFDYYFNDYLNVGLGFDYMGFAFDTTNVSVTVLPIQARLMGHWPITETFDIYAGTGAGMFVVRYADPIANLEMETFWGLTPRAGMRVQFAQDVWLDIGGTYAMVMTETERDDVSGIINIHIGIAYNLAADF